MKTKGITFTTDERSLLQVLLKLRLDEFNNSLADVEETDFPKKSTYKKAHVKPIEAALEKISHCETAFYSREEKSAFISCVKENYDSFGKELELTSAIWWLTITEDQIAEVHKLDCCKNILSKCGYYKKDGNSKRVDPDFRYENILTTVNKLKRSELILLTKAGQTDLYKVTFIYEGKEYFAIKLTQQIEIKNERWVSLNGKKIEDVLMNSFTTTATKNEAKEILAMCPAYQFPKGMLDFMNLVLN